MHGYTSRMSFFPYAWQSSESKIFTKELLKADRSVGSREGRWAAHWLQPIMQTSLPYTVLDEWHTQGF